MIMMSGIYVRVTAINIDDGENFILETTGGHSVYILFEDGKLSFYNQVNNYHKGAEGVQFARLDGTWTQEVRDG